MIKTKEPLYGGLITKINFAAKAKELDEKAVNTDWQKQK